MSFQPDRREDAFRLVSEFEPAGDQVRAIAELVEGIIAAAERYGVPATGAAVRSMWGVFFCEGPVTNFQEAEEVDRELFAEFHRGCLAGGVFLAPSPFEAGFLSTAHTDADIDRTLEVVEGALAKAAGRG